MKQQTTIKFLSIPILALLLVTSLQAQELPLVKHVDDLPFYVPARDISDRNSQTLVKYPGLDYVGSNQMAFDSQNRPYLYNERSSLHAGYLLTLRNGIWTKIHFQNTVETQLKANFEAAADYTMYWSTYAHANSSIHIDGDNALYMMIWARGGHTAGRVILVYSPDITVVNPTFTVHSFGATSSAYVEINSGFNDVSVPPAFGVNSGGSFGVYLPTKNSDGSLNLGDLIHLGDDAVTRFAHSGGRSWGVSKNGKVFASWQGGVIPGTTTPENAYWIAEIDRATRTATTKYLGLGEGFAAKPDDHNFSTLTIDGQGYLHYIKGSHGPGGSLDFQYGRSPSPYSINGTWNFHDWEDSNASYNSTVVTTDNKIICTARRTWQWLGFSTKSNSSANDWTDWKSLFSTDLPFGNQEGGAYYNAPAQREVADRSGNVYYQACLRNANTADGGEWWVAQTTISFNAAVDSVRIMTRHDYLERIINGKSVQRITFEQGDVALSSSPLTLNASSDMGLPINYEVISGPATVSGNALTLTGIGEVTLKAKNTGNTTYYGDEVVRSFQVTDGVQIPAEADIYVRSGSYGNDNYGTDASLIIKKSNTGDSYNREAYYRFDLSSVSGTITDAKLRLVPSGNSSNVGAASIEVKFVGDDSWSETGTTWNNKPSTGSVLATQSGSASTMEWDVTSQVQTENSGDGKFSVNINAAVNNGQWVHYHSREASNTSLRPVLVVTTSSQSTVTSSISSSADSYIRSGSYGNDNYGNDTALIVKRSNTGDSYSREAYYRFDLSTVSGTITEAKLKLVPSGSSGNVGAIGVDVKFVSDDSWNETGITWNNRPTAGSVVSSQAGSASATEWDVTSQAQTEKSGDGQLSLNISATVNNGQWVHYYSKETANSADRPVLVVTTTGGGASNLKAVLDTPLITSSAIKEVTTVYPNPFTNWIQIVSPNKIQKYWIYSTTGVLLLSSENVNGNEVKIDMTSLTKGVYILKVLGSDSSINDFKVVK
ncbi:DNRLRE domain-containing protein [Maribacter sp. 2304DJ31-5]|uniref:CBM96 family carbohydrate-binding protein n=1 Tax=Maribacter sp. 2304DJ31-5 TaxID=3386273 RepID=UPI0039BC2231